MPLALVEWHGLQRAAASAGMDAGTVMASRFGIGEAVAAAIGHAVLGVVSTLPMHSRFVGGMRSEFACESFEADGVVETDGQERGDEHQCEDADEAAADERGSVNMREEVESCEVQFAGEVVAGRVIVEAVNVAEKFTKVVSGAMEDEGEEEVEERVADRDQA